MMQKYLTYIILKEAIETFMGLKELEEATKKVTEDHSKENSYDFGKDVDDLLHDLRAWYMTAGYNKEEANYKVIQRVTEFLNSVPKEDKK